MRMFHQPAAHCAVCERPAPDDALACLYCGEDLPQRRRRLCRRAGIAAAALFTTAAFAAVRGGLVFPGRLTLPAAALLALGIGLTLQPPTLCGVVGATRYERLWQVAPRYVGGMALALLTALLLLAVCTPKVWSPGDLALGAAAALTLLATPVSLGLPWHKIAAGALLAAGSILSR